VLNSQGSPDGSSRSGKPSASVCQALAQPCRPHCLHLLHPTNWIASLTICSSIYSIPSTRPSRGRIKYVPRALLGVGTGCSKCCTVLPAPLGASTTTFGTVAPAHTLYLCPGCSTKCTTLPAPLKAGEASRRFCFQIPFEFEYFYLSPLPE
jgi:hypothetical protein